MLPFEVNYINKEYWANERSIKSIADEWKVNRAEIHKFMVEKGILRRGRALSIQLAYKNGSKTNSKSSRTEKSLVALSEKMKQVHSKLSQKELDKKRIKATIEMKLRDWRWKKEFRKKGAASANFSKRKATLIAEYIGAQLATSGYAVALDRRPADIVLNDDIAIVIDGYFRIKNLGKPEWVAKRKAKLDEYGFSKIIFCKFPFNFSKVKADILLRSIVEIGIISKEIEVIL